MKTFAILMAVFLVVSMISVVMAGSSEEGNNSCLKSTWWGLIWAEWGGSLFHWTYDSLEGGIGLCTIGMEG